MSFDWNYALSILPSILWASVTTFFATIGGMAVALVLGLPLAICRLQKRKWLATAAQVYVDFVRTTPLLIQLYLLYYWLPYYGIRLNAATTGTLGLGIHYSTYLSEVFRAGIANVAKGQWEASTSLGLSMPRTWLRIILPQAMPAIIPPIGNYLVAMFKATPFLAFITVNEMLGVALEQASISFRYAEPILIVGVLFIVYSYAAAFFVRRIETLARGYL